MVPPNAADFIEQRLSGMTMQRREFDGEIRGHEYMGEGDKSEGQKYELSNRRAVTKFHHPRLIARRAHHRDDSLQQSYAKGEDKGDMSEFGAHEGCT